MQKIFSTAMAVIMLGVTAAPPALAQGKPSMKQRQQYVQSYCAKNPNSRDCQDFRRNPNSWDDARYQRWYRDHGRNDAAAAALFGLAAGAIIGGALGAASSQSHADRCAAQYRSYDPATDTYLGTDGRRHRCQL